MFLKPVKTLHGDFVTFELDQYVSKCLQVQGQYMEHELENLYKLCDENSTVMDIGANLGAFTVPLAKRCKTVIAFEPQRLVYQALVANCVLNDITNVLAFNAAVISPTDKRKYIMPDMYIDNNPGSMFLVDAKTQRAVDGTRGYNYDIMREQGGFVSPVTTMTLAMFTPVWDTIDLIKIDVEGHEFEVLRSIHKANKTTGHKPYLWVETDKNATVIHDMLDHMGYEHEMGQWRVWEDDNFNGAPENLWWGNEVCTNTYAWPK